MSERKRGATGRPGARRSGAAVLRVLRNLSSDWFWEQDARHRFTRVEALNPKAGELPIASSILGKRRWEAGVEIEGGWEAHRAVLAARLPFRDVLMWRTAEHGSRRYVSVSGEPTFDRSGRFAGYCGVGRDVTGQKRNEQLLRLEHDVARTLSEADSAAAGLHTVLRAVCRSEGWGCGRCFKIDAAAQLLRFEDAWCQPEPEYQRFLEASRAVVFRRGEGLAGLVWQNGEPVWSADTSNDPRVLARSIAQDSRIRGAFVCGIVAGGETIGVLTFSSDTVREPEPRLLQTARVIGSQVGQFLQRKEAEAILRASEERFRRTFELAGSGVAHVSLEGRVLRVNRRFCEILDRPEGDLIGRSVKELSHPDDRDATDEQRARMHAGELDMARFEKRYLRGDGAVVWVALNVALERDAADTPLYEIAVIDDITEKKKMEAALRESEERFRSLTQMSSDFFWESDPQHRLSELVHGPGYGQAANQKAIGKATWEIPSASPDAAGWAAHRDTLERHLPFRDFEFARTAHDGSVRHFSVSGAPRFDAGGRFLGYRGVGRDITEIVQARERIASLAYSDALTGLANRVSLGPALDQAVQRARRRHGKVAVAFIDLDGFKQVNDTLGHHAGDALLIEVAHRLRAHLRASDLVARLGGDEFLVVLEEVHDLAPIETVARKLTIELGRPYAVADRPALVTASIGLSLYPDDASDAASLLKHADIAMYAAKQSGKNGFSFYAAVHAANEPAQAAERPGALRA